MSWSVVLRKIPGAGGGGEGGAGAGTLGRGVPQLLLPVLKDPSFPVSWWPTQACDRRAG